MAVEEEVIEERRAGPANVIRAGKHGGRPTDPPEARPAGTREGPRKTPQDRRRRIDLTYTRKEHGALTITFADRRFDQFWVTDTVTQTRRQA